MYISLSLLVLTVVLAVDGASISSKNGVTTFEGHELGRGRHDITAIKENGKVYYLVKTTPEDSSEEPTERKFLAKDQTVQNYHAVIDGQSSSAFSSNTSGNNTMADFKMPPFPPMTFPPMTFHMPTMPPMPPMKFQMPPMTPMVFPPGFPFN